MSTEYDQLREKIRNISTEAPPSTKKAAEQLMKFLMRKFKNY